MNSIASILVRYEFSEARYEPRFIFMRLVREVARFIS